MERGVERLQRRLDASEEDSGTPNLFSPSPSPVQDEEEDRESRESEVTPDDIAGPAHWIEEIQGLVEPAPGEDGEEETPLDESPEPGPEGGGPDGDDHQGGDPEGDDPEEVARVQTYQLGTPRSTRFVELRMVRDTIQTTDAVL